MGGSTLAGKEVPIAGSDSVKWFDVSVPSTSSAPLSAVDGATAFPPLFTISTEDAASCSVIGEPPTYLTWRIHKGQPRTLEIQEFCGYEQFPQIGLRISFPDALYPFAFICKDETKYASGNPYLLYALTISGVAYMFRLKRINNYASCSVFPSTEVTEFDIQNYPHSGAITSVAAAAAGSLLIGKVDGSVSCFLLGTVDPSAPGFMHELRDDVGFGRLWGLVSRRSVSAVQDLVVSDVCGRELLFVLHCDGTLRVWDFLSHSRIFCDAVNVPKPAGTTISRLWVGKVSGEVGVIPLAILHKSSQENSDTICIASLHYGLRDKSTLLLDSSVQTIPLEEGELIDVKLASKKIWILKDNGIVALSLLNTHDNGKGAHCYSLQEAFIADQLFQSSDHSPHDLLWLSQSIFSCNKDQIAPFVSSIFLRRLLSPGVRHSSVLRATFQDYRKHLTDSEFYSLTVDGLKKEILSLVEQEGMREGPSSMLHCWKTFTTRYLHHWCKLNAPFGLLIDSSREAVGLIRKSSVSLFRSLEDIELVIYGSFDEIGEVINKGLDFSDDNNDREVLFEVLRCVSNVSQQLGKSASAIFYESVLGELSVSSEDVLPRLLKVLESGYSSSVAALHVSELGADIAWEKEAADHKNLRKFSVEMFVSLHSLSYKAATWSKVLDVIESYLKFLVPQKKIQEFDTEVGFNINTSAMVQATSQVAKVMFESALDVLLLLSYLVNISGQIQILHDDVARIQLELVPMIQEIITEWHIVFFLGTMASEAPAAEDFSSQLSCLQIDNSIGKRSWTEKLGKCDFPLACVLLLHARCFSEEQNHVLLKCFPDPISITYSVRDFTSWIMWGSVDQGPAFFAHSTELALILLKHGQYDAVEYLLTIVDAHSSKEKTSESIQSDGGEWGIRLHLLGCCLLAQALRGLHGTLKEKKVTEAIRCFFRASAVRGAPEALQSLSTEAGLAHVGSVDHSEAWKLHYYQWAMQIFEQHNLSEGACQFALAALEQVDEALGRTDDNPKEDNLNESTVTVKGRLWANVFKFTLDLSYYYDAYCAIISNPDEESKYICLRRFIIVLYERGAVKILCDGQIPFIGLTEKVEQELAWKAGRSDVSAQPNPFKLLYSFEMHRHNWRKAAIYIYLYSDQLRTEATSKDHQRRSLILQERLNGISAAINALHLVHPAYAWIDPLLEEHSLPKECYPSKKARLTMHEQHIGEDVQVQRSQSYLDIEKLENEFLLTSAEYMLALANINWTFTGNVNPPPEVVDMLVEVDLYDMAFTIILKFWKGSALHRELERVFTAISLKCCPHKAGPTLVGNGARPLSRLLTSSRDEMVIHGSIDSSLSIQQSKGNSQWETLELYLEKYKAFHRRLPVVVAETLLSSDHQIELPLWLVQMFKGSRKGSVWGMAGSEANPAALFRLYVDYGRYAEATNLFLEYIESFASMRPADVVRRKRACAAWFPYTTVERLWVQLEKLIGAGHKVDQSRKLKDLLGGALESHLNQIRVDSDDVMSSAACKIAKGPPIL